MNWASIIPAAAISKEEVAVLRQQAQFQIAESTAIKKLGMKPNNKSNLPTKAFDKNGNQLFGRGVEKVSLNIRLDKPMFDLLVSHCNDTSMTKAMAVRQMILVQVAK